MKGTVYMPGDPDLGLWQSIAKDEKDAFQKLFRKYWMPLEKYASLYLSDRSERDEVLQELFIELYRKRYKIKIHISVPSFLIKLTKCRIFNYLRYKSTYQKHICLASAHQYREDRNTEDAIAFREACKRIQGALAVMPDRYRQVYILSKENQFTLQQTARYLKRPVPTVEKQLRKALNYLKDGLTDLVEINTNLNISKK